MVSNTFQLQPEPSPGTADPLHSPSTCVSYLGAQQSAAQQSAAVAGEQSMQRLGGGGGATEGGREVETWEGERAGGRGKGGAPDQ